MVGQGHQSVAPEKRGIEELNLVKEQNKKLKLDIEDHDSLSITKYIIVPIATVGCGKTTLALTLNNLFPKWGHIQNDEIADGKHVPNALEKACLKFLASSTSEDGIYDEQNVLFIDRNNHMHRERSSLLSSLTSLKKSFFPNDKQFVESIGKKVEYQFKFIALNFLTKEDMAGTEESIESSELWQITHERIFLRGANHQSIKLNTKDDLRKVDEIMKGFINRFEDFDPSREPDSLFDFVINLDIHQKESTRANVDVVLKTLNEKTPQIFGETALPDKNQIDLAYYKALKYKPTLAKVFNSKGGSIVYDKSLSRTSNWSTGRKPVQEDGVGITKYISPNQLSFSGTLKQRYTDFLVNEIDLNDKVVHLENEGFQNKKDRRQEKRETVRNDTQPKENLFNVTDDQKAKLIEMLGEEDFENLRETVTKSRKMVTKKTFTEKSKRTEFHQLLREVFNSKLESITNDDQTIKIGIAHNRSRNPDRLKQKQNDPHGLGPKKEFLHFVMYKQNKDTMEAANVLAKITRANPKSIRYAGTKDRRACTVQKLCMHRGDAGRMNTLNKSLRGIKLGSFSYQDEGLNLGDLNGNEFVITLRDVTSFHPQKSVNEIMAENFETLKTKGFINYFGMQRFGTFSISTHEIGKEILLGNWEAACELLLSNQQYVLPDSVQAREIWEATRDPHVTLQYMPRKCLAETCILRALCEDTQRANFKGLNSNSFFQGIMKIPRNLRIMYGHAYQSYVWNCVASKRFELFGLEVVPGDLVIGSENTAQLNDDNDDEVLEGGEDVRNDVFIRARPVTEAEVKEGKFDIYDIVLPSPGFDVVYPENPAIRQVYVDVMKNDGLDPFQMVRSVREFSFAGSYRHLINKPYNLEYFIRKYEDPVQELVADDLKILQEYKKSLRLQKPINVEATEASETSNGSESRIAKNETDSTTESTLSNNGAVFATVSTVKNKDTVVTQQDQYKFDESKRILPEMGGARTAVIIKMRLGTSAYATMALRELMKIDTTRRSESFDVKN